MYTDCSPHEAHLRDVAGRFASISHLETEAYRLLETDPFQPDIVAILDAIQERRLATLRALHRARRQLRHTCRLRSANHVLQIEDAARMLWNWMERQQLIDRNPWRQLQRGREQEVVIDPPTACQVQAMYDAARRPRRVPAWVRMRDAALVALLFDTGLRRAEALGLRRGVVHTETVRVLGKSNVERVIRISEPVRAAVRAYIAAYEAAHGTLPDDAPLWWGRFGAPMTSSALYDAVRQAGRRVGIVARPHLLRHAFATEFIEATNDVVSAAALLGHRGQDLRMTRRYSRVVEQRRALRQHTEHSPALRLRLSPE